MSYGYGILKTDLVWIKYKWNVCVSISDIIKIRLFYLTIYRIHRWSSSLSCVVHTMAKFFGTGIVLHQKTAMILKCMWLWNWTIYLLKYISAIGLNCYQMKKRNLWHSIYVISMRMSIRTHTHMRMHSRLTHYLNKNYR